MPVERYWDGTTWRDVFATAGYDTTPIGSVITHTSSIVPAGLLLADGQQVGEIDYPDLAAYAATEVGRGNTLWAISGATPNRTITVPDLRDRFLYSAGSKALGIKSQTNPALANPGEVAHVVTIAEMPAHSHPISADNPPRLVNDGAQYGYQPAYGTGNTSSTGGGQSHNNMPPYCVLAFFVKAKGIVAPAGVAIGPTGPAGGSVYSAVIGDGVATNFAVDHPFNTKSVTVSIYRNTSPFDEIEADVERTSASRITIRTMPTVPAVGEYTVLIAAAGQAATLDITMDGWHNVGAAGEPAFGGAWVNFGGGEATVGFRKLPDGRVVLRGLAKAGTTSPIFTLPPGYRPPTGNPTFACLAHNGSSYGVGQVYINASTGEVRPINAPFNYMLGGSAYVALDEIEFDTEAVLQTASVAAQPLDVMHIVGAAGEPAYQNGWLPVSAPAYNAMFRKDPFGKVLLRGMLRTGTVGTAAFTLPVGFRPTQNIEFCTMATGGTVLCRTIVQSDGAVILYISNGNHSIAGIEFDTETVNAYASGIIGPPRATILPANPVEGQECYFVADAVNGLLWHLRYNAAWVTNAYKWEVVGGSALAINDDSNLALSNAAWTNGGTIVVPLAGVYDVETDANMYATGAATTLQHQVVTGGSQWIYATQWAPSAGAAHQVGGAGRRRTFTAGMVLQDQYFSNTTGGIARYRNVSAMPVRVG